MEVQMAAQGTKSTGTNSGSGGGSGNKPVPGYMRPSAGSCHHVCKYGGTHTFEDHNHNHNHNHKEPHSSRPTHPRPPRKQPPPPPAPAPAPGESHKHSHSHNRVLVKVRSVFRRRVVDSNSNSNSNSTTATHQKPSKAAAAAAGKVGKAAKVGNGVEWKDIAAYDTVPPQPHGSSTQVTDDSGDVKKKDVTKGKKKPYGKAKVHEQVVDGGVVEDRRQDEALDTKATNTDSNKRVKPPPPEGKKNKPTHLLVENMAEMLQVEGYQIMSPSLAQSRADLLRDLEKEMMAQQQQQEQQAAATTANNLKEQQTTTTTTSVHVLDPEDYAAAAAEFSSRPIPAHRRVQSMSMSGLSSMSNSRSVRHAFGRQASRNSSSSAVFKVRSRSTRAAPPAAAAGEEKPPARLRSRRGSLGGGGEDGSSSAASTGRGIHLRIRSLRRRGVGGGGGGGGGGGFVVPAVALRHQKTLDKKKSQRLYNNLIEETASKLVKTRKSRVKALVGAFESVISKIAK